MAGVQSVSFEYPPADELARDDAWWAIYDESFPASEREPRAVILGSVRQGVGVAARARRGQTVAGLATVHLLRRPAAVFLVYLAVAPALRGRGLGGPLLEDVYRVAADRLARAGAPLAGLVWEVDAPALAATADERQRRERRIEFFRRLGGALLPRPYAQPPLQGTEPVPMRLMYRPAAGAGWPDGAAADALVRAMYFEKYGAANGISAEILERLYGEAARDGGTEAPARE
jgi:GNAT superfamily N-acetyltransferase